MTTINDVTAALLAGVLAELVAVGAEAPDRACVVPGDLAWDECECGLLAVRWTGNSYGQTVTSNAADIDGGCGLPYVNVGINVVLLRCVAGPQTGGDPPTCEQLSTAAAILHRDVFAMEKAIATVVVDLLDSGAIIGFALNGQSPTGPQGNCVGTSYNLTVGIKNTWRPCG